MHLCLIREWRILVGINSGAKVSICLWPVDIELQSNLITSAHVETRTEACHQLYQAEPATILVLSLFHAATWGVSNGAEQTWTS